MGSLGNNEFCYEDLTPRQWVLLYLLIHRFSLEFCRAAELFQNVTQHEPYVRLFPSHILTSLSFSGSELGLLEGTSLHRATLQRLDLLHDSAKSVQQWLLREAKKHMNAALETLSNFSNSENWIRLWIWADTAYASRSFPPLLGGWPVEDDPVLIPGFDILNHRRGEPVTWSFDSPDKAVFTIRQDYGPNEQIFNNYGAKSNEELLMTYGFVEPGGPDDVLVLALRSDPEKPQSIHYWRRSDPEPPASLLEQCRGVITMKSDDPIGVLLAEVHAIEAIEQFLRQKWKIFKRTQIDVDDAIPFEDTQDYIRMEALNMIHNYREGMSFVELTEGQALLIRRGLTWCQDRLDNILDHLEQLGWTP